MISNLLLSCASVGLMCCTGYLLIVVIAVVRFRVRKFRHHHRFTPCVSLFKPLHGLEPQLEGNLESFFQQDYPNLELIFGARHDSDPALHIVRQLRIKYPNVPVRIVLSGEPDRPNAKVCTLREMEEVALAEFYVISDSDVRVQPNYLREIIAPFKDPEVGVVTCLYRGVPTGGIWSRLEALGMSVEMTSGALAAELLEGMKFALGPTMVVTRDAVQQIGGLSSLADYCSDDYLLGNWIESRGYKVVLSHHAIDHLVVNRSLLASMQHQVRWMKSTRFSRPKGHFVTALTFAIPWGFLGLTGALLRHHAVLGWELLAIAVLNRLTLALATGWGVLEDWRSVAFCWLYPLRDIMGFCFWAASYMDNTIIWRDQLYRLEYGGKMYRATAEIEAPSMRLL